MKPVYTVFSPKYCTTAAPLTSTTKQLDVVNEAMSRKMVEIVFDTEWDEKRTWIDITRVHDPKYVKAVRTGSPRYLAESQSFKWSPAFAESVARIWSGHYYASKVALREKLCFHPVSGAHHAHKQHGEGFCTFNFLVGAAIRLMYEGHITNTAILDLDAHHGNGTVDLVGNDSRFKIFDISGYAPRYRLKRPGLNIYGARNTMQYMNALRRLPDWLDKHQPELVQYQAGVDCHESDSVGSISGMTDLVLEARDQFVITEVLKRNIPLVVILAGGYQEHGRSVALHVRTVELMQDALQSIA